MKIRNPLAKPVHYVNAIPSAGKSWKLKNKINKEKKQGKTLICLPTAKLIKEYEQDLTVSIHKILSDDSSLSVVHQLKAALASDFYIEVILCTHDCLELYCQQAAFDESMQQALQGVSIVVDECPYGAFGAQVRVQHEAFAQDNFPFLAWLEEREKGGLFLNEIYREQMQRYYDENHAKSEDLKKIVWCLLRDSALLAEEDERGYWYTAEAANPLILASQWAASFIIMAAGVDKSELLYRAEHHLGFTIEQAPASFQPDAARATFKRTDQITISYIFNEPASMNALAPVFMDVIHWIKRNFREGFLYATNNDKTLKGEQANFTSLADQHLSATGERISMSAYGLNYYAGFNVCGKDEDFLRYLQVKHTAAAYEGFAQCAYLGIVNDEPFHLQRRRKYADCMGWDFEELSKRRHEQQNAERCLQVLARTVIRDHNNLKPVHFLVPDKQTAEYLQASYFPNCELNALNFYRKLRDTSKGDLQLERVKELKAEGKKIAEIAQILSLSEPQVKRYSARIKKEAA